VTGDILRDLLEPLIGQHGSVSMALGKGGHVSVVWNSDPDSTPGQFL
jgi:hypothetical protein